MASEKKKVRNTKYCFIALMCTTVAELAVLLALAGYWRVLRENIIEAKHQELCYKWDRFTSAEDKERCLEGLTPDFNKEENVTMCCGNATFVLDKLVSKAVSDKYNSNINPEMSALDLTGFNCEATKIQQPIANLAGLDKSKQPVLVGTSSKVFWNPHNRSYADSGIKHLVDDGTLYVTKPGFYYISSQIKISFGNRSDTGGDVHQIFRHYVHRISYNKGTADTLLEDAKTRCDTVTNTSEVTSILGALFKLEEGDRLYVATSHPQYLSFEDGNRFLAYLHNEKLFDG